MDERIEDLLAIYALGGLTDEEKRRVDTYLDSHSDAAVELESYLQAASALAFAAVPMQPSKTTELDLMGRVEADAKKRMEMVSRDVSKRFVEQKRPLSTPPSSTAPSVWSWLKTMLSSPALSAAGLGFAAILVIWSATLMGRNAALQSDNAGLATQNELLSGQIDDLAADIGTLQQENAALSDENLTLTVRLTSLTQENDDLAKQATSLSQNASDLEAEITELVAMNAQLTDEYVELDRSTQTARNVMNILTSPTVHTAPIPGNPETQPEAFGQFVVDASSQTALLIVTGMDTLPEGSVYQVLLIQGSEHETAETFVVDTQGESVLIVNSEQPMGNFDAVGVSIEPDGGSVQRTGEVVLIGSLIN